MSLFQDKLNQLFEQYNSPDEETYLHAREIILVYKDNLKALLDSYVYRLIFLHIFEETLPDKRNYLRDRNRGILDNLFVYIRKYPLTEADNTVIKFFETETLP